MNLDLILSTYRSCKVGWLIWLACTEPISNKHDDCWLGQGCGAFSLLLGLYCHPPQAGERWPWIWWVRFHVMKPNKTCSSVVFLIGMMWNLCCIKSGELLVFNLILKHSKIFLWISSIKGLISRDFFWYYWLKSWNCFQVFNTSLLFSLYAQVFWMPFLYQFFHYLVISMNQSWIYNQLFHLQRWHLKWKVWVWIWTYWLHSSHFDSDLLGFWFKPQVKHDDVINTYFVTIFGMYNLCRCILHSVIDGPILWEEYVSWQSSRACG